MSLYSVVWKFRIAQMGKVECAKFAHSLQYNQRILMWYVLKWNIPHHIREDIGRGDMRMKCIGAATSVGEGVST